MSIVHSKHFHFFLFLPYDDRNTNESIYLFCRIAFLLNEIANKRNSALSLLNSNSFDAFSIEALDKIIIVIFFLINAYAQLNLFIYGRFFSCRSEE